MFEFRAHLFGKAGIQCSGQDININGRKAQELLFYLLFHRTTHHTRERIAELFWPECSPNQSRSYLRKALWQIQRSITEHEKNTPLLLTTTDWIQVHPKANIWLDTCVFEQACTSTSGIFGKELDDHSVLMIENAIELYRGDLLEGCYHDWCLQERDRLKDMLVALLIKLSAYHESCRQFEKGLAYTTRVLIIDSTNEDAHYQMMRIYYSMGNRAAALRQYQLCKETLAQELGVQPRSGIVDIYEKIQTGQSLQILSRKKIEDTVPAKRPGEFLSQLRGIEQQIIVLQNHVRQEIQHLEASIRERSSDD